MMAKNNSAIIVLTPQFMHAYCELGAEKRKAADNALKKFGANPRHQSLNNEALKGASRGLRSIRGTQSLRLIFTKISGEKNAYRFLHVDQHDDSYEWSDRHSKTEGGMVYDPSTERERRFVGPDSAAALFGGLADADLERLGADEKSMGVVRGLHSPSEIAEAGLDDDLQFTLTMLANPDIPVSDVIRCVSDRDDVPAEITGSPLPTRRVVLETERELDDALDARLEEWRLFLHPRQRKIIEKRYRGPAKVVGGAGTGKTVVAIYRTQHLAAQLVEAGSQEKVLFTTFNRGLTKYVQDCLQAMCTAEELERIRVVHIDGLLTEMRGSFLEVNRVVYGDDEKAKLWTSAKGESGYDGQEDEAFFVKEWEQVVIPNQAFSLDGYLAAPRPGRGKSFAKSKRKKVWKVIEAYLDNLQKNEKWDDDYAMLRAADYLTENPGTLEYRHIVIDEVQDFSFGSLRFVRALAGEPKSDDIFLVGDARQRIWRVPTSLKASGINTKGRSECLYLNYRTTRQIQQLAQSVLGNCSYDDLDNGALPRVVQSLTSGGEPDVREFRTMEEECEFIANSIADLVEGGCPPESICVMARTNALTKGYKDAIKGKRGIQIKELANTNVDLSSGRVNFARMSLVKGFEFDYVFIAGLTKKNMPFADDYDAATLKEERALGFPRERSLLHVAITRARYALYVTSTGTMSEFIVRS